MTTPKAMIEARIPSFRQCHKCFSTLFHEEVYFATIEENNHLLVFCSHKCVSEFLEKTPETEKAK